MSLKTIIGGLLAGFLSVVPALAAETRSYTDDAGRTVEVPAHPQRIASLHDLFFTVPLIELGVMPAGSHGRIANDGSVYLRSSKMLTGVDFDNSDIAFLGTGVDIDPETVAALKPDLIILSTNQKPEQFESIAPTILLDFRRNDKFELYERLAELTGTTAVLDTLKTRYNEQIEQLRKVVDTGEISVNVIAAIDGQVRSYRHFASLGRVLDDAGFAMPDAVADVEYGQYADFSPEFLPRMDADLIFVTYRADFGHTPDVAYQELEDLVPNFCSYLTACENGRVIAIPRDKTFASSYGALGILSYTVLAMTTEPASKR